MDLPSNIYEGFARTESDFEDNILCDLLNEIENETTGNARSSELRENENRSRTAHATAETAERSRRAEGRRRNIRTLTSDSVAVPTVSTTSCSNSSSLSNWLTRSSKRKNNCERTTALKMNLALTKLRRSSIWEYFKETGIKGKRKCNICNCIVTGDNTTNCSTHLKKVHPAILIADAEVEDSDTSITSVTSETENDHDRDNERAARTIRSREKQLNTATNKNNDGTTTNTEREPTETEPERNAAGAGAKTKRLPLGQNGIANSSKAIRKRKSAITNYFVKRRNKPLYKKSGDRWKILNFHLLRMIVLDFQPFSIVENKGFCGFVKEMDCRYELPSRKHLSVTLLSLCFSVCLRKLKEMLKDVSNIAITFDSWTSNKNNSFIAVTGHFLSHENELQSTLLKLIHSSDIAHTGKNVADIITMQVLEPNNIKDKTVCAVTDNGSNMVLAVNTMGVRHLNCFAHTLQLVINGAIAACKEPPKAPTIKPVQSKSAPNAPVVQNVFTEVEEDEISAILAEENIPAHLSVYSMILKCKKIVGHFNLSTTSMNILRAEMKRRNLSITDLIQEVPTRWNSTFYMLDRVYQVLDVIHVVKPKIKNCDMPNFEPEEIEAFPEVISILKLFDEATEALSASSYPSISLIIPAIKGINTALDEFKETKCQISKDFMNELKIKAKKLERFENHYATQIATLLDPRFKDEGFVDQSRYRRAVETLKGELKTFHGVNTNVALRNAKKPGTATNAAGASTSSSTEEIETTTAPQAKSIPKLFKFLSKPSKSNNSTRASVPKALTMAEVVLQLNSYTEADREEFDCNPLKYWTDRPANDLLKPVALKYLIIPATSVPSECVFSTAGNTQTDHRSRLSPLNLQKIVFLNRNIDLMTADDVL